MSGVSTYTPDTGIAICERLAAGESMRSICKDPLMPCLKTVYTWLIRHPEFELLYAKAREAQAEYLAQEILDIADTPVMGTTIKTKEDGTQEIVEGDMIQHRRLQVDSRKWYAAKVAPKRWGDRVEVDAKVDMTVKTLSQEIASLNTQDVIDVAVREVLPLDDRSTNDDREHYRDGSPDGDS